MFNNIKMKKRRDVREFFRNNLLSLTFLIILICLGVVLAGNVIVKEGNMDVSGTGNFSNRLFVNSTNVGIGISNPIKNLDVNGVIGIDSMNFISALHPWNILWSRDASGGLQIYESTGTYPRVTFLDGGNVGIGTANPSYPLQVNSNVSGISIYSQANISATDYMKHTAVYDKSRGKALDFIKDSSQYLNPDGTINHKAFYGYATYEHEYCNFDNETGTRICETQKEDAVSISEEEAKFEQAIYELKIENELLKSELCKKDNSYEWC